MTAVTLTAGNLAGIAFGYGRVGNSLGSSFGSITGQPFAGRTIDYIVTGAIANVAFVGNTVAMGTPTLVVDGVTWTVGAGSFNGTVTEYPITPGGGGFVDLGVYTVNDTAGGPTTHATTGALTGPGAVVAGTAARVPLPVTHTTSGVLTGPGASIVGAAGTGGFILLENGDFLLLESGDQFVLEPGENSGGGAVTHGTTGALVGPGAAIAGISQRLRAHAASGGLTGQGSTIAGTARHNIRHAATGTLTGPGANLSGTSSRYHQFSTSGSLVGPGSTLSGASARLSPAVTHATSGALVGPGATITGSAANAEQPVVEPDPITFPVREPKRVRSARKDIEEVVREADRPAKIAKAPVPPTAPATSPPAPQFTAQIEALRAQLVVIQADQARAAIEAEIAQLMEEQRIRLLWDDEAAAILLLTA